MRRCFIHFHSFFLLFFLSAFPLLGQANSQKDTVPVFPDLVYEFRMAKLHKNSAIDLEFNASVRKYIEIYTLQRRADVSRLLGLKDYYFPIFEEYLDKYGLPLELKYLPVIESGLDPLAKSSSGAMGLWQFLYHSANMFDLKMTSFTDERCDVYKSTDAACRYLKYLYQTFNNWALVLSAFNGGPGVVRNAMARSGGKTAYNDLVSYFPEQTQNYVPAFMAMIYVLNYPDEHHIHKLDPPFSLTQVDTIRVKYNLHFSELSKRINLDLETIRYLNPTYKLDFIPESDDPNILILPRDKITIYLRQENQLYANSLNQSRISTGKIEKQKKTYTVKQGDFLHKIAMQNGCSLEELKEWNNLKTDSVSIGQKLVIWVNQSFEEPNLVNPSSR